MTRTNKKKKTCVSPLVKINTTLQDWINIESIRLVDISFPHKIFRQKGTRNMFSNTMPPSHGHGKQSKKTKKIQSETIN